MCLFLRSNFLLLTIFSFCFQAKGAGELSTPWILNQIESHHLTRIDDVLARFSPKSLERHLLIYDSESLQFASYLSPRVIVYDYDADFIMTFNGEPESKGYYDLEILRFDHSNATFHPERISFDPKGVAPPKFEPHPKVCADCHQTDVRPNWDPYFHWVGLYGSEDDNMNAGPYGADLVTSGPEIEHFNSFLEKQKEQVAAGKGRYRFLPPHPSRRPNLDFNERVSCVNIKHMLRVFARQPLAAKILPAMSNGVIRIDELPADLKPNTGPSYEKVKAETEAQLRLAIQRRLKRQAVLTGGAPVGRVRDLMTVSPNQDNTMYELETIASWRYVFEKILKIPFRPFSTSFHFDYSLNNEADVYLISLTRGARVDEKSGRVVFDPTLKYRSAHDYGYTCTQAASYFDLPEAN